MRTYRFSWKSFPAPLLQAVAATYGLAADAASLTHEQLADLLTERVPRPSEELVRAIKDDLARHWLPSYAGSAALVERLRESGIGPGGNPTTKEGYADYVLHTRNCKTLRALLLEAMRRFGDDDREDDGALDPLTLRRFARLRPADQPADPRRDQPHQIDAWDALKAGLANAEAAGEPGFQGLLVMPTGSGKTYTAVRWLIDHVLRRGQRVLWIAHRYELLDQAAKEFYRQAGRLRDATNLDELRIRLVSGRHCSTSSIDPGDHVVIVNVSAVARNHDRIRDLLLDKNTFVVIDEAHHATAKSYADLVRISAESGAHRLLGLTATPTRTAERERGQLARLFGNKIHYQIDLRTLIERKLLARPIPVTVKTNADMEAGVTEADRLHLARFKELSDEWRDRIAHDTRRNDVIVAHYLEHASKYGRTLVFGLNVPHAAMLADALKAKGVRADYVASYRVDEAAVSNAEIVDAFRKGELDVLVNVEIMTEGVDVPEVQTVFLTRPTRSEILVRQMIGRALRGPAAGGSEVAYIVAFEDQWRTHANWENPLDLVPDMVDVPESPTLPTPRGRALVEHLPWDLIRDVANAIRSRGLEYNADAFTAVPSGTYVVELVVEDEYERHIVPVYEHHEPWWELLFSRLRDFAAAAAAAASDAGDGEAQQPAPAPDAAALYAEVFADCDDPLPALEHVEWVVQGFLEHGAPPSFTPLEGRAACDPHEVAKRILEGDLGPRAQGELLEAAYGDLARAIYPSLRDFRAAVDDALFELQHPDQVTSAPPTTPFFGDGPSEPLPAPRPGTHAHDLEALLADVLHEGAEWLRSLDLVAEAPLPGAPTVEWSTHPIKGWYGKAIYEHHTTPGNGRILINTLLDSPAVSQATIKFLLWHEYLHLLLKTGHPPEFRRREKAFPGYIEADRELDNLQNRFNFRWY